MKAVLENVRYSPGSVYWLEQAASLHAVTPREPLTGTRTFDVCIIGGGYTGLWTAIELKRLDAALKVAVVEAQVCGYGASGRNAGWLTNWADELAGLVDRFGEEHALWLADQMDETVRGIGTFLAGEGVDCHHRPLGALWVGSTETQLAAVDAAEATARRLARGHWVRPVGADEVKEMTGVRREMRGVFIDGVAAVQPALLGRGLREIALRNGVEIFEGSPMVSLEKTATPVVQTTAGRVHADQMVLATNAWAVREPEIRRSVFVVGSQMVLTEPVPDRLGDTAWSRGLLFGDARMFVHASQVTTDGRILFTRAGGAASIGNRVIPKHFSDPESLARTVADFRAWFPEFSDVAITHGWGGAVDRSPGHIPFVDTLGDHGNIHYTIGYSGNGVGPSAMFGKIMARRALGIADELSTSGLVGPPPGKLPPDPFRFLGGVLVREAVQRAEEREEEGRSAGSLGGLAKRMVNFSLPTLTRDKSVR